MALTVTQNGAPAELVLSRQPVVFVVRSDDHEHTPLHIIGRIPTEPGDCILPNVSGEATFEMSEFIAGRGMPDIAALSAPVAYTKDTQAFEFVELYPDTEADPPTEHGAITTDPFTIIAGRVPVHMQGIYASYNSLLAYLIASKRALTWYPGTHPKRVTATSMELLPFLQVQSSGGATLTLGVSVVFTDATTGTMSSVFSIGASYLQTVAFPVGYTELGIAAWAATNHPGKEVHTYTVTVYSGATAVSLPYSYRLYAGYLPDTRVLAFRNQFGCWETLLCSGHIMQEYEYAPEKATLGGINSRSTITVRNEGKRRATVQSGWMKREAMQWLASLLESTDVREVSGTGFIKVTLSDNRPAVEHEGMMQFEAAISYEYSPETYVETE